MKNKLKELTEISNHQIQVRFAFEDKIEKTIKDKLQIDLIVCYHHHSSAIVILNNDNSIYIHFDFLNNKIENKSQIGNIKKSQKVIKIINNLFK